MTSDLRNRFSRRTFVLAAFLLAMAAWPVAGRAQGNAPAKAKNVIIMIADGASADHYTLARWFEGKPLPTDEIGVGMVRTYISDSVIADSAPAASAFATGVRTCDKLIGVGPGPKVLDCEPPTPAELLYRPVPSVLEGARLSGRATGIVVTSQLPHATPAAFMSHVPSRYMEPDSMEQGVFQGIDVAFGGGMSLLLPAKRGTRNDGQDLTEVLRKRGYQIVETCEAMKELKRGKVFGMFAPGAMASAVDRPRTRPTEPTLAEMTGKAIELLAANPKGFFLMVEGSHLDWAGHANDPAQTLHDVVGFERAVVAALEFAKRDGDTLLLVLSDHNTGGMTIGNMRTSDTYTKQKIADLVGPLKKMRASSPVVWEAIYPSDSKVKIQEIPPQRVHDVILDLWGLEITMNDAQAVIDAAVRHQRGSPFFGLNEVISAKYTVIGWTTHGHSGGDVPLFAYGPGRPVGVFDAPAIARTMATAMEFDLQKLQDRLLVDAAEAMPGAKIEVTKAPGPRIVRIALGEKTAELPVNQNILRLSGRETELEGVVVVSQTGKVYLPRQAIDLIKGQ